MLVATYYRTNLTMHQVAPLCGIKQAAVHRIIDRLGPHLALISGNRRHAPDTVLVADGTLVPAHDHAVAAAAKNYRYSTNVQVIIDPQPGNRNDGTAYRTSDVLTAAAGAPIIAEGTYRGPDCTKVIIAHRKPAGGTCLPAWKQAPTGLTPASPPRVEHIFARMKNWKVLRDCRRRGTGPAHATQAVAPIHRGL